MSSHAQSDCAFGRKQTQGSADGCLLVWRLPESLTRAMLDRLHELYTSEPLGTSISVSSSVSAGSTPSAASAPAAVGSGASDTTDASAGGVKPPSLTELEKAFAALEGDHSSNKEEAKSSKRKTAVRTAKVKKQHAPVSRSVDTGVTVTPLSGKVASAVKSYERPLSRGGAASPTKVKRASEVYGMKAVDSAAANKRAAGDKRMSVGSPSHGPAAKPAESVVPISAVANTGVNAATVPTAVTDTSAAAPIAARFKLNSDVLPEWARTSQLSPDPASVPNAGVVKVGNMTSMPYVAGFKSSRLIACLLASCV